MRSVEEIQNEIAQVDAEIASIKSRIANAEKYGDAPDDAWTAFVDSGDRSGLENYRTRIENEKQREFDRARMAAEEKKAESEAISTADYNLKKAVAEYNQAAQQYEDSGATVDKYSLDRERLNWEKAYTDYIRATGNAPGDEYMPPVKGARIGSNEDGKKLNTEAGGVLKKYEKISSDNTSSEIQAAIDGLNGILGKFDNQNDEMPKTIQNRIIELENHKKKRDKDEAKAKAVENLSDAAAAEYNKMDSTGKKQAEKKGFTFKYGNTEVFVKLNEKGTLWVQQTKKVTE